MRCCVAALWVSALTTLVAAASDDAHHDLAPPQTDNELELTDEDKRAWQSLHGGGGWGKRGWQDLNSAWGKRAWQDLNSAWGKRAWQDLNSAWGKRAWQDLNSAWGKRGWQDLNSAWGKRGWQDLNSAWGKRAWRDMSQMPWGKRGWQDMSSAWGKRGWQDMSSAWGKRGWQDMSSAWGKRAPEKWANFHGSWGKRSGPETDYEDLDSTIEQLIPVEQLEEAEREAMEAPEKKAWNALHGAWGKRPVRQHINNDCRELRSRPRSHVWDRDRVSLNTPIHTRTLHLSRPHTSRLSERGLKVQELKGAYYWKREPGWTNLRGMWGKRSASEPLEADEHENAPRDEA